MRRRPPGIAIIVARFVHISLPLFQLNASTYFPSNGFWSLCNQFHLVDLVQTAHKTYTQDEMQANHAMLKLSYVCVIQSIFSENNVEHFAANNKHKKKTNWREREKNNIGRD